MTLQQFLFSFRGRVNRAKYWLFVLCSIIAVGAVILVVYPLMGSIAYVAIVGAAYLLLIYTSIAVAVKRLHDRDKSAWWLLVFYGAPLAVTAVAMALRLDEMISTIATMLIMIWAFVEFGCLRGTAGPNKYGADPLQEPQPWLRYH